MNQVQQVENNHHQHNTHNNFKIWQQNLNGFYSKSELIELLCKCYEPNICLFQELFRSNETIEKNKQLNNHSYFDHMYKMIVSYTGRAGILYKNDHNNYKQLSFDKLPKLKDKWNQCGFETVWMELKHPGNQSIIFCSLYRDGTRTQVAGQDESGDVAAVAAAAAADEVADEAEPAFDLSRFVAEFRAAKEISPNIIIGGDFNCKHWLWGSTNDDPIGDKIADFIWDHNLQVLNEKHYGPTCRRKTSDNESDEQQGSFIDITLVTPSISNLVGNWIGGNYYYEIASDHEPITYELYIDELNSKLFDKNKTRTVWNFTQADWERYQEAIEMDMQDFVEQFEPIWNDNSKNNVPAFEQALKEWYKIINTVSNNCVGKKQITPRANKFWSKRATQLKQKVTELKKQLKRDKNNDELYHEYNEARKHYKKVVKNHKKQYHSKLFKTINDPEKKKQMFSIVRRLTRNRIISIGHIESNNKQSDDDHVIRYATTTPEKAEILANQFAKPPQPPDDDTFDNEIEVTDFIENHVNPLRKQELFEDEEKQEIEIGEYHYFNDNNNDELTPQEKELQLLNRPINCKEIEAAIMHVGGWKASGPDNIHNQLLKHGGDYFILSLKILFNWSYTIGYMPKQWKLCNIAPIPKPNRDHTKAKNYRPIALLSCVGKLLERIFSQRLLKYLKETHLLSENQAGFQSYHNTYELLLKLTEHIYQSFRNNSILEAVFLDISSAYDSVWRDGLKYKLRKMFFITGKFYWWIDSFFKNRQGRVVIDGIQSKWKLFNTGVPQGSSLSPLLFIMYINDISNIINIESQIGMFADDVALWTTPINGNNNNSINNMIYQHNKLQESLDKISQWCTKWKLLLSQHKTQYIIFKSPWKKKIPSTKTTRTIKLNNTIIKPMNKIKYLGLYFDPYLTFKPHIKQYLLPKLMKRVGWLKYITNLNGGYPHILVYQSLYKMLLRPAIDYACPFWNGANNNIKKILNKIQRISLNRGMKLMKNVSYDITNIINNIEPLELRRKHEELKLFKRCRIYSVNFPKHTLSIIYKYWYNNRPINNVFNYKLSVLTRASINSHLYSIKSMPTINQLLQLPKIKQIPQLIQLPRPTNTPFKLSWPDKHYNTVLTTFNHQDESSQHRTVIFTDGSCPKNPGYGGAGVVIFPPINKVNNKPIELSYPIDGITTNIAAEIGAILKAIEWINNNIKNKKERIILFSDCKPVIDSILNRTNPYHYGHIIRLIQNKICNLINVPEIYWIKSHIGIKGNEIADKIARQAAQIAIENNGIKTFGSLKIADEAKHLSSLQIEQELYKQWNKEWIKKPGIDQLITNTSMKYSHVIKIIPTVEFGKELFHKLLVSLKTNELRVISRLISGNVNLRYYMNKINIYNDPYCRYCGYYAAQSIINKNKLKHWSDQLLLFKFNNNDNPMEKREETIEHYLFKCPAFIKQRNQLFKNINKIIKENKITLQLLLTGYPCNKWKQRKKIVKHTISFIKQTNRMNI